MESSQLYRAQMLLAQRRFQEAETMVKSHLAQEPNDSEGLHLLSVIQYQKREFKLALATIETAISIAPDSPEFHHMRALVQLARAEKNDAEQSLRTAISMKPEHPDFHVLKAEIEYSRSQFDNALKAVQLALQLQPDHIEARNVQSKILLALNRDQEAFDSIAGSLQEDPENSWTHAEVGWNHLRKNDHKKALESFKEALRLNPHNEYAKGGLVEALKAKYLIYRWFLQYIFWFQKHQKNTQMYIIVGAYIGVQILRYLAETNPALEPFFLPILIAYLVFALSTWVLNPIFNTLLLLNPYGKFALTKHSKLSAQASAILLAGILIGGIGFVFTGLDHLLMLGIACFGLIIPVTHTIEASDPEPQKLLIAYSGALVLLAISALVLSPNIEELHFTGNLFFFGFIIYQWIANFLIFKRN